MASIQTKRRTPAEYDRLIDLGVFGPGDRLELRGGQVIVAEPQGAEPYSAVRRANRGEPIAPLAAPSSRISVSPLAP